MCGGGEVCKVCVVEVRSAKCVVQVRSVRCVWWG